jgi:hypothetical protein
MEHGNIKPKIDSLLSPGIMQAIKAQNITQI